MNLSELTWGIVQDTSGYKELYSTMQFDTQTGWKVARILTTVDMEEISLQK